jgi:gas vesicle protein
MNERASHMSSVFYLLLGGVAGAGVALLLAPQSGRESRDRMGRKLRLSAGSMRTLKDRVARKGQEIRAEATRRMDEAASALAGNGRPQDVAKTEVAAPR